MTMLSLPVDPATLVALLTAAGYGVTPPASNTTPKLSVIMSQNGKTPLPQDYSFSAKAAPAAGGDGNPNCMLVTVSAPWGGYQPSNNNGVSTDFSKVSNLLVSVNAPKGTPFSMYFMMAGDVPILGGVNQPLMFDFTKTVDGWERFSVAKAKLMTDYVKGDVSKAIYKGCVQYQLTTKGSFSVDNWGGQ